MNNFFRVFIFTSLLLPSTIEAQIDSSIRLNCPLNEAYLVPPPKNMIHYDPPDLCAVLVSMPDTIVKSVYNGIITNIDTDDDMKVGIVIFSRINKQDYYFWYSGLSKVIVHKNEKVKTGQPIGFICQGDKIELNMYQFETQVDPSKYIDCKTVIRNE